MKAQDKHPIDELFKKGLNQDFPFDPQMWEKAEGQIVAINHKKKVMAWSLVALTCLSIIGMYMFYKPLSKSHISKNVITVNAIENELKKGTVAEESKSSTTENEIAAETNEFASQKIQSKPSKTLNTKLNDVAGSENQLRVPSDINGDQSPRQPEFSISNSDGLNDVDGETPIQEPKIISKPELNEEATNVVSTIDFENWSFNKKRIPDFGYLTTGQANPAMLLKQPHVRKFALTFEFEQLFKTNNQYKLSGLPEQQLKYRQQYEKSGSAHASYLNVMLQRGGFGFITGIGLINQTFKTSYMVERTNYQFETRYVMVKENIPYSGGTYSQIREIQDTTSVSKNNMLLEGQSEENQMQWIAVPLKVSYQYPWLRFRFALRAGADFMFMNRAGGKIINSDQTGLVNLSDGANGLNKFNVSANAGIYAGYMLNKNMQFGGSYSLNKQMLSNFSGYSSGFAGKGFSVYLRYSF